MGIEYTSTATSFQHSFFTLSSVLQCRSILSVFCYLLLMMSAFGQQYRCPLIVLSIDHSSQNNGTYFNFEKSTGDNILGDTDWDYANYYIFNSRTNATTLCILFTESAGGSHSAHGRKDVGFYGNGDWQIGDTLYFINVDVFCNKTQYFNKQSNIILWEYESISSTEFSSDWKLSSTKWTYTGSGIPRLLLWGTGYIYLQDATNTKGYYQIQLELNLGISNGYPLDSGEYAEVRYSIDNSFNWVSLQTYTQIELPVEWEIIELPAECNDNDGIRIQIRNTGTGYSGDVFYISTSMRLTATLLPTGDCSVSVTSVDHISNEMGKYFNFDSEVVDEMLNSVDWDVHTFSNVYNSRTEQNYTIKMWRDNGGGSTGTAHGRKDPIDTAHEDDWQIGDLLIINHYSCDAPSNEEPTNQTVPLSTILTETDNVASTTYPTIPSTQTSTVNQSLHLIYTLSSREISSQDTTSPLSLSEASTWASYDSLWRQYDYQQELDHLSQLYQMVGGGFMVVFTSLTILSWIDARYVRINNYFKVGGIISMMLQTLDMMSDCFFAVELSIRSKVRSDIEYITIFYSSILFIIFPTLIALFQLYKHVRKYWMDPDNDFVRGWLSKYATILLLLSVVTGSSFAAVSLLNSYIFQMELFDMGLTKKQRTAFNTRRIYSIVLFENMPQLALQTYYLFLEGAANNPITVSSIVFSIISIIVSILSMTLTKAINYTQGYVVISVNVTGNCVEAKVSKCKTMNRGLKERIGTLIGVDPSIIEVTKPILVANGFKVSFHVYSNKKSNYDHSMKECIDNGKLGKAFQNAWKLSDVPKVSNLSTDNIPSKDEIKIRMNLDQPYTQATPTITGSTPTIDTII